MDTERSSADDRDDASDDEQAASLRYRGTVSLFRIPKGVKHWLLNSLLPSKEHYCKLVSYRFYLLANATSNRTSVSTTRLHRTLKNLELNHADGLSYWPESVQHFIHTYAADTPFRKSNRGIGIPSSIHQRDRKFIPFTSWQHHLLLWQFAHL